MIILRNTVQSSVSNKFEIKSVQNYGVGHTVFGVDLIGIRVSVALYYFQVSLWTSGEIETNFARI